MTLRFGKKPAAPRPSDFMLRDVTVDLPHAPRRFGNGTIYKSDGSGWGMLANDLLGDCVPAETCHGTMLVNKLAGRTVRFTDPDAIRFYEEAAGYDPNDPSTDQGTDMHTAMSLRRTKGVQDSLGVRHKIDAFVSIDAHDFDLMLRCVYTFGMVAMGFEFPAEAMTQFNNGEPWDVGGDETIEGGHDVLVVGSIDSHNEASCVTWGQRQRLTKAFYEKHNDETWVPLSLELLNAAGLGLHHLKVDRLHELLNSLG